MPTYERYGDDHEVVETVITVDGSPRDRQVANSKAWKLVDGEQEPAPAAAPKTRAAAPAKPPAKEG